MDRPSTATMSGIVDLGPEHMSWVAQIHASAFPGSVLTILGHEAVRRYYEWQLLGPHDVVARGAFCGHQLIGFCFGGIFRGALSGYLRKNRMYLLSRLLLQPWLLATAEVRGQLGAGWRALIPSKRAAGVPVAKSSSQRPFGILAIATDPSYTRQGIGRGLMEEMEREARARGFGVMMLTVHPENTPSVCFYERLGWERTLEKGCWRGRMEKRVAHLD